MGKKVIESLYRIVLRDGARSKIDGFGQLREREAYTNKRDKKIGMAGRGRLSIELSRDNRFETLEKNAE